MVDFERATEIATSFAHKQGHVFARLKTTVPRENGWDFHFDVGAVSEEILVISINKDGKIKMVGSQVETIVIPKLRPESAAEELEQLLKEFVSKHNVSPEELAGLLLSFGLTNFKAAVEEGLGTSTGSHKHGC